MPKLLKEFSNEDIERVVHSVLFNLRESVGNPFTMPEETRNNPLMEGYFKTYAPDKVYRYLSKRYGDGAIVETLENENGIMVFRVTVYNDEKNKSLVDKDMALCGYYPSIVSKSWDDSTMYITYEPRHQDKVNEIVYKKPFIYHLTYSEKVDKIMRNGLTPKTNNKLFNYPDRVYFFLERPDVDLCRELIKQFNREEVKLYQTGKLKRVYDGDYTLLKVNTKKIGGVNFSYDPNAYDCVYTYQNINPKAIIIEKEIKRK